MSNLAHLTDAGKASVVPFGDFIAAQQKPTEKSPAVAFLRALDAEGWHNLVRFDPSGARGPIGLTIPPGRWDIAERFVAEFAGQENLYFSVNEPKPNAPDKKLEKQDIAAIRAIPADVDLPAANDDAAVAALQAKVAADCATLPSPSFLIDSGGGIQAHWQLAEKLPATAEAVEWAEAQGRAIARELGGDAVGNVDRIMRLPGAVNIPTDGKRAKGRVARPASLIDQTGATHSPDALRVALPPISAATGDRLDRNENIAELQKELAARWFDVASASSLDELPTDLQDRFRRAMEDSPRLTALWRGEPPRSGDVTGSGYRAALAQALGHAGGFDAFDFAALVWVWDPAVQPQHDRDEKLTPRALARDWLNIGEATPSAADLVQQWFEERPDQNPLFPEAPSEGTTTKPRFAFENFDDLAGRAISQQSRPLIKGLLDQGAMTVLYGESNSGKTFVALNIAFHIATGRPWNGMRVIEAPVVYVAAEGGQGFAKRVAALRQRYGSPAAGRFHALRSAIDLLRADADLVPLVDAIRSLPARPGLLVLDTLSRVMAGGDENASTDMGALVRNLDALRAALGCHLMVVHHTGKDRSKGARGHSLLRAATDTEIEIVDGKIVATKQRDIERNAAASFALEQVTLGVDLEGDPVTSAVVRILPAEEAEATPAANESAEDVELRQRIARAAYRALDGATSANVGAKRRRLVDEMAVVGVKVGTSPPVVRGKIEWALASGVTIEADGQVVRIQAAKSGSAATAPWTISAFRVPGEAGTGAISSEEKGTGAEAAKLDCASNTTVFD